MRFYEAACEGRVEDMQQILDSNPNFDINGLPTGFAHCDPYSFVQMAATNGHYDAVKLPLAHPNIDIDFAGWYGFTPFILACCAGHHRVARLFLRHPKQHFELRREPYYIPAVWSSAKMGSTSLIKWIIALHGNKANPLDVGRINSDLDQNEYTAIEIAEVEGHPETAELLRRLRVDPAGVRYDVLKEVGLLRLLAADLFALVVFICDDLLALATSAGKKEEEKERETAEAKRFFKMVVRLPMELQMVVCHHVYSSHGDSILSKESEAAFRALARVIQEEH